MRSEEVLAFNQETKRILNSVKCTINNRIIAHTGLTKETTGLENCRPRYSYNIICYRNITPGKLDLLSISMT